MGCLLVLAGLFGASVASADNAPAPFWWGGLGLIGLCLVLGTVLQMTGRFDD